MSYFFLFYHSIQETESNLGKDTKAQFDETTTKQEKTVESVNLTTAETPMTTGALATSEEQENSSMFKSTLLKEKDLPLFVLIKF